MTRVALHWVRKVSALGVACMELRGAPLREGFELVKAPEHVCTKPAWCELINAWQRPGEPAAVTARRNAYFEDGEDGEVDRRSNRLFCSQACLDEAGGK